MLIAQSSGLRAVIAMMLTGAGVCAAGSPVGCPQPCSGSSSEVAPAQFTFAAAGDLLGPYRPRLELSDTNVAELRGLFRSADVGFANAESSIADLAHLSFPGMDLTRSVFSANFIPRTRITANRDYDAFKRNWAADADHAQPAALLQCELSVKAAQAQQGQAELGEAQ